MSGERGLPQRLDHDGAGVVLWRRNQESPYAYAADSTSVWRERLQVLRRHKWIVLACCALGVAVGVWLARREVPMYRATAVLRFESPQEIAAMGAAQGLAPLGEQTALMTELELLTSRRMSDVLVDSLGLTVEAPSAVRRQISEAAASGSMQGASLDVRFRSHDYAVLDDEGEEIARAAYGEPVEAHGTRLVVAGKPEGVERARVTVWDESAAADAIRQGLEARIRPGTELVDLSYSSDDPEFAARVVNTAARVYEDMNRDNARRRAQARVEFMSAQLLRADSTLTAARGEYVEFQESEGAAHSDAEFQQWQTTSLEQEAEVVRLASDRRALASILSSADRSGATDLDLQALVHGPVAAGNETVQRLYRLYLGYKEERQALVSGQWGAAETNPKVERLDRLMRETKDEILSSVRNLTRIQDQQLGAARQRLGHARGRMGGLPTDAATEEELSRRMGSSQVVVEELRSELLRAQIDKVLEVGSVEIVDLATVPGLPEGSSRVRTVLFWLLLGGLVGAASAFVTEWHDTTVKSRKQVEAVLRVPLLGTVPRAKGVENGGLKRFLPSTRKDADRARPLLALDGGPVQALMSEAYRSLRTNLMFSQVVQELKTILVTSAVPGEGKTTSAANLAMAFARQGIRTLLIDADLRKPQIHRVFNVPNVPGLSDLLIGPGEMHDIARQAKVEHLYVLPSGRDAYNPAEILGSARFRQLLDTARDRFEIVLIDTPPVLAFTDACVVAAIADGVILVVHAGRTNQEEARAAVRQLHDVGARILGSLLNDVDPSMGEEYGYGYASYYASTTGSDET